PAGRLDPGHPQVADRAGVGERGQPAGRGRPLGGQRADRPAVDLGQPHPRLRPGQQPGQLSPHLTGRVRPVDGRAELRLRPGLGQRHPRERVQVVRAGPDDLDALAGVALAQTRSETEFGSAVDRPDPAGQVRAELAGLLAGPEPWVWLAEVDGRPVGALTAERPAATGWLAPFTDARPVGYLRMARVEPAGR